MAAEQKNIINKFLAWILGSTITIVGIVFAAGGFYTTTSATNKTLPQHISEDRENYQQLLLEQKGTSIAVNELKDQMKLFADEMGKMNDALIRLDVVKKEDRIESNYPKLTGK